MIVTDYDLPSKVNDANGVVNYQKILLDKLKGQTLACGIVSMIQVAAVGEIWWSQNLVIHGSFTLAGTALEATSKSRMNAKKNKAYSDLVKLTNNLAHLNIHTSPILLTDIILDAVEYEIKLNSNYIPTLMQNKHILIPTYNYNREIEDEPTSIFQEHAIGSKKYTLRLRPTQKRNQPSLSYGI